MADVQLKVDGKIYRGWTAMQVQRGIEQAAGAFALGLTERWPGQPQQWPIEPGVECQLLLDEQPVITGYVDSVERQLGSTEHSIKIVGRDKAADIVDSAAVLPGDRNGCLKSQTLEKFASLLCRPYSIKITNATGNNSKLSQACAHNSETVWESIERYARQLAVLIVSDGQGSLTITRAGTTLNPNTLIEGNNILTAKFSRDNSQRFSRYIVRGQQSGASIDDPSKAAHSEASTTDKSISRERLLLFDAEDLANGINMRDRVRWERNIRRARSRRVTVTVQGWSANGHVWQPNEMVQVQLPTLGIDSQLLIVSVSHTLDQQGSRTELLLSPKEAYELLPESAEAEGGGMVAGVSADTMELLQ